MARAPHPGRCHAGLEPLLGPQGCAELQRVLLARAGAWAQATAPGRVHIAVAPPGAGGELAELVDAKSAFDQAGDDPGERVLHASTRVLEHAGGPLLVIGTAVPALTEAHAGAALGDMAAGCDVSLGPTTGGSCYLLALSRALPQLADLRRTDDEPLPLLARALSAASGLRLGLLRSERALAGEADARALAADPLTPGEVREALRSYGAAP